MFINENVTVKDPFKVLKSIINELESKTDMIILLFNASEKDLNRLKTKNYAVDFAVRSRSNLPPKVSKDGGSSNIPVYSIGMRGKYVFEFDINIGDTSSDFIDLMYIQSKLEKSEKFLRTHNIDFEESVDLDAEFKDDPKTLKQIKNNLETRESLKYQLNNAVNYFSFEKYSLDKQIKDDLRILSIIDKGKARINELHGPVPDDKGRLPSDPHHGHNH